jgi:hypothetical protein
MENGQWTMRAARCSILHSPLSILVRTANAQHIIAARDQRQECGQAGQATDKRQRADPVQALQRPVPGIAAPIGTAGVLLDPLIFTYVGCVHDPVLSFRRCDDTMTRRHDDATTRRDDDATTTRRRHDDTTGQPANVPTCQRRSPRACPRASGGGDNLPTPIPASLPPRRRV